jgi:hypothetical protein
VFLERIGGKARHFHAFGRSRQHLQQERVERVAGAHPVDEPPRHEQRKVADRLASLLSEGGVESEQPAEFLRITHGIGQFPLPAAARRLGRWR